MDVSSVSNKNLDGFYNELRRKYPNTFTLATDLGKRDESLQKLPRLERTPSPTHLGILPNPLNTPPQRWTPESFLSKVKLQKRQNEQRQEVEASQQNGGAVIIQGKTIPVPTWNRRDYLAAQDKTSFHLPTLRTQVEHNKAELKTRLNFTRKINDEVKNNQSPILRPSKSQKSPELRTSSESTSTAVATNVSVRKSDPLGTIMKELLPSKPGQLMMDRPKSSDTFYRNGSYVSDSDSGVSVCAPIKVFRPKIRSPHDAPASSDIIKKFSTKTKTHSGPVKADHTVLPEDITQSMSNSSENFCPKKSSINYNEKIQQRPPTGRVRFEDESVQEVDARYQERRLLERNQTAKISSDILIRPQAKSMERLKMPEATGTSPSSSAGEKSQTTAPQSIGQQATGQQTINLPYRRQPFPPNVAKKVLIDIPRSGLPNRRPIQPRTSPVVKDKQLSSSIGKEATPLDGLSLSLTGAKHAWKEQIAGISGNKEEENKNHHSLSSLETIGSGVTEVSSEVTITTLEWRGSGSSIGSENHTRPSSQNQEIRLQRPPMGKGPELSFYSRMKRSLHVKMKLSPDTGSLPDSSDSGSQLSKTPEVDHRSDPTLKLNRRENVVSHEKSSPYGAIGLSQVIIRENESSRISKNRMKKDAALRSEAQERDVAVKPPFLSVRMMQSLLKKGRAKNYVVRVPSPPPPESRFVRGSAERNLHLVISTGNLGSGR
ncbi:uncharacterized protein [Hyperolius riggenbachi]|uniref:uncharacterized protein isoform X2 n=1 Tax=Hyperolius riggenbachi TaxID=752182 RepID=UPI0035A36207